MDVFLLAAIILLFAMVPAFWVCVRSDDMNRLVALEFASNTAAMLMLLLAVAFRRASYSDLALTLAFLSYGGGLVFARFLERWL